MEKQISEVTLTALLSQELPEESRKAFASSCTMMDTYRTIQQFVSVTKHFIYTHEFKKVKICFCIADKLLKQGNYQVQNAMITIYLSSLSPLLDSKNEFSEVLHYLLSIDLELASRRQLKSMYKW